MAAGEETWAQGWSEPDAGSDLARLKSRARRDGDHWVLNGQKAWSTRAVFCDYLFGLFRSDPEAERHRGLTYFLVPLDADGVTVRPVAGLHDDVAFAEIFLEDVVVTGDQVLGGVDEGWRVAMATAGSERGLNLRSPGRFMAAADRLVDLYRRVGDQADPGLRDEVAKAWMAADAYRLYTFQSVTRMVEEGRPMGFEASLNKIWWSELDVHLHRTAQRLLGPLAEVGLGERLAPDESRWLDGWLFSLAGPIYAGTNEIQRNVVAERVLGLPRVR
jgi:alkylation response protein AidB-like acyl-CoA dehydrogenase